MPLAPGIRLGPYEILASAGAGGMGEVYRARDARLERTVAVKVLPESVAGDADRLRRFELEARAVAALNHPNILSIHDTGAHQGTHYLVSEFLEGETLRQRLESGALPVRKAVDYALQTCRGLAAAHEKGITHRDLKPDNIFLTRDGRVKILDFGLAKLRPAEAVAAQATVSSPAPTSAGTVLGTAGYMSPEQVRGLAVDPRTDIFSLGAVLYEMLSGKRAFHGETAADTMSAILKDEPAELTATNRNLPPGLERIVRHCLEKNPEERFQSAHDIAFALEALSDVNVTSASGAAAKLDFRPKLRVRMVVALAAVVIALAAGGAIGFHLRPSAFSPAFRPVTFRLGSMGDARFTPDGEMIYSAAWDGKKAELYVARQGSPGDRSLGMPESEVVAVSKDGELAILTNIISGGSGYANYGTLARVSLSGGAPRPVLDNVQFADWSADGRSMTITRFVPATGKWRLEYPVGKVLYETAGWVSHPRISPTGDRIAFLDHPAPQGDDRGDVAVTDLEGHKTVLSTGFGSVQGVAWHSPDELWFTATRTGTSRELYAVTLSGKERKLLSAPSNLLLQDISPKGALLMTAENHRDGVLGVAPGESREKELAWFNWSIARDITPDGKTVLLEEEGDAGGLNYLVYLRNTDGSPAVRLGDGQAFGISPDRKWVLARLPGGGNPLRILPIGTGEPRDITHGERDYSVGRWLPDSKHILAIGLEPGHGPRNYLLDIDGGQPRAMTPEGTRGVVLSQDGKSVAVRDAEGKRLIWSLEGGEPKPVAGVAENEVMIAWLADNLLYVTPNSGPDILPRKIFAVSPATGARQLWKTIAPTDLTGITNVAAPRISSDGRAYAYTYSRVLSDLYIVEGVE